MDGTPMAEVDPIAMEVAAEEEGPPSPSPVPVATDWEGPLKLA